MQSQENFPFCPLLSSLLDSETASGAVVCRLHFFCPSGKSWRASKKSVLLLRPCLTWLLARRAMERSERFLRRDSGQVLGCSQGSHAVAQRWSSGSDLPGSAGASPAVSCASRDTSQCLDALCVGGTPKRFSAGRQKQRARRPRSPGRRISLLELHRFDSAKDDRLLRRLLTRAPHSARAAAGWSLLISRGRTIVAP
jgi:hypothetical protein